MIIGLTGKNAAGKGETAKYLEKNGFISYSLSDIIRDECKERNLLPTRDNMIIVGNDLRTKNSPNYLAVKMNQKIAEGLRNNKNANFAIDSIRSPYEANELKKIKNFKLIGIDADSKLRFQRMLKRDRIGDAKTFENFLLDEKKENLKNDNGQQLDNTFAMSDVVVKNEETLSELYKKLDELIKK